MENELAKIGNFWAYLAILRSEKVWKSIKGEHLKLARSEFRSFSPILFRNAAETEQLAAEKAVFEQFDLSIRRALSVKDAQFKLLLSQRRVSPVCQTAMLSNCWDWECEIEKLERRTNLAEEEQKENELNESGSFRDRLPQWKEGGFRLLGCCMPVCRWNVKEKMPERGKKCFFRLFINKQTNSSSASPILLS